MTITFNWIQGSAGSPSYPAIVDRQILSALLDEGVVRGLKVTANGVDRTLSVGVGQGVITGDDSSGQGNYLATLTGSNTLVMTAAPGANSRIDLLGLKVQDVTEGGPAGNNIVLAKVDGTAAANPVPPAVPDSFLVLCQSRIAAGQTFFQQSDLTDRRLFTEPRQSVGSVKLWIGPSNRIPVGWVLLQGQVVGTAAAYPELADLLGVSSGNVTLPADTQGRVLAGLSSTDTSFGPNVGKQAGAKTQVIAINNVPQHTHTIDHTHAGGALTGYVTADHSHGFTTGGQSADHAHGTGSLSQFLVSAFSNAFSVLEPGGAGAAGQSYTAGATSDHSHSGQTGGISANHQHAVPAMSLSGTNSGPAGSAPNDGLSVLQPSVALYVIVRVL